MTLPGPATRKTLRFCIRRLRGRLRTSKSRLNTRGCGRCRRRSSCVVGHASKASLLRHRRRIERWTVVLGAFSALLITEPARANGALPAVSQLLADPDAPDHLYLRSTFGLFVTRDQGATWDFLCEEGMGYRDVEPPMAILPGGTILLALPEGVSRGEPGGCDFRRAEGIDQSVVDLSRIPAEPGSAIAVSLSGAVSQLWLSTDEGRSFTTLGEPLDGLIASTVDVAPSNPKVVYLS